MPAFSKCVRFAKKCFVPCFLCLWDAITDFREIALPTLE